MHALGFVWCNMVHMTNWVLNGIPERFPKLKSIWVESGLAWVPFLMQRLDDQFLMRPSEAPQLKRCRASTCARTAATRRSRWRRRIPRRWKHAGDDQRRNPAAVRVRLAAFRFRPAGDDLRSAVPVRAGQAQHPRAQRGAHLPSRPDAAEEAPDAGIFPNRERTRVIACHGRTCCGHPRLVAMQRKRRAHGGGYRALRQPRATPPIIGFALAQPRSWFFTGSTRMRLPVAAKIALHSAGATGGTGGSPTPPQKPPLGTITVSTGGASAMRSIS